VVQIPPEFDGARVTVAKAAEVVCMSAGHLRRLVRRGVLPSPKRTAKGKPFYDYPLLCEIAAVLRKGVGISGEEICFYRRRKPDSKKVNGRCRQAPQEQQTKDAYVLSVTEGCRQLGVPEVNPATVMAVLKELFVGDRPALEQSIPAVARRLLRDK
jgi:hypothetical protein